MPLSTSTATVTKTDRRGRGCANVGFGKIVMASPGQPTRDAREQFVEFARTRDERQRNELVESHLGLAHQLARRFVSRGEAYDDLVQVASLALVKAVDRFDPSGGWSSARSRPGR